MQTASEHNFNAPYGFTMMLPMVCEMVYFRIKPDWDSSPIFVVGVKHPINPVRMKEVTFQVSPNYTPVDKRFTYVGSAMLNGEMMHCWAAEQ